jgi:hypothetical protein
MGNRRIDTVGTLRLSEQASCDVAHVRLFQLVVFATVTVDTDVFERGDHGLDVETHGDEAVYEIFVVAVVPSSVSVLTQTIEEQDNIRSESDLCFIRLCVL